MSDSKAQMSYRTECDVIYCEILLRLIQFVKRIAGYFGVRSLLCIHKLSKTRRVNFDGRLKFRVAMGEMGGGADQPKRTLRKISTNMRIQKSLETVEILE